MAFKRLLSIDPSLTCSGWALFSLDSGGIQAVGKVRSLGASYPLATRLLDLQNKIVKIYDRLEIDADDVLVCESPTAMIDPNAALKMEQVRCIFEVIARQRSVSVPGRINPRSVHYEVMGLRGKQLARNIIKETAITIVKEFYGAQLNSLGFEADESSLAKNQDIVDAILVGRLGVINVQHAAAAGISVEEIFEEKAGKVRASLH